MRTRRPKAAADDTTPGGRLTLAMRRRDITDGELATQVTELLRRSDKAGTRRTVPPQTVQANRTKHADKVGAYLIHYAYVLRVDPFWLAFGEGSMVSEHRGHSAWPFRWPRSRWEQLSDEQRLSLESFLDGKISAFEERRGQDAAQSTGADQPKTYARRN